MQNRSASFFSRRRFAVAWLACLSLTWWLSAPLAYTKGSAKAPTVPTPEELKPLLEKTTLDIDKALETKDFAALHATLSPAWQKQITPERLAGVVAGLAGNNVRLDTIKGTEPIIDSPPMLDAQGVLTVSGYYPTAPHRVRFDYRFYNKDSGQWKLLGIILNIQEVDRTTKKVLLPRTQDCQSYAGTTLLELNLSLEKQDFSALLVDSMPTFQRTATAERMKTTFAKLAADGVHVETSAADSSPTVTFSQPPALMPNDDLHLVGTALAKPAPVTFDFLYRLEGSTWKLNGIVVNGLGGDLDKPAPAATPAPKTKAKSK